MDIVGNSITQDSIIVGQNAAEDLAKPAAKTMLETILINNSAIFIASVAVLAVYFLGTSNHSYLNRAEKQVKYNATACIVSGTLLFVYFLAMILKISRNPDLALSIKLPNYSPLSLTH